MSVEIKKRKIQTVMTVMLTEEGEIRIMGDKDIFGDNIKYNELMSKIFFAMANWHRNQKKMPPRIITPKLYH